MPNSYTHALYAGEPETFETFALKAARMFMPLYHMRDEPLDAPLRPRPLDTYYLDRISALTKELEEAEARTAEDWVAFANMTYLADLGTTEIYSEEREAIRQRYEAMLAQAVTWEPPTPEHDGLKEQMISTLKQSLEFDCGGSSYMPVRQTPEQAKESELKRIRSGLEHAQEDWQREQDNYKYANEWIEELQNALSQEKAAT